jgi:hypothetical protein
MSTITTPTTTTVASLMQLAGLGWRYDAYGPAEKVEAYLKKRLLLADQSAQSRFPEGEVRLTPDTIADLAQRAPHKARAFLEQLFGEGEPSMLVMVWRVLAGVDVARVQFDMRQADSFRLEVTLRPDRKGTEEHYLSEDVDDVYVVRHFGVS